LFYLLLSKNIQIGILFAHLIYSKSIPCFSITLLSAAGNDLFSDDVTQSNKALCTYAASSLQ
jgi:hypothetical protein